MFNVGFWCKNTRKKLRTGNGKKSICSLDVRVCLSDARASWYRGELFWFSKQSLPLCSLVWPIFLAEKKEKYQNWFSDGHDFKPPWHKKKWKSMTVKSTLDLTSFNKLFTSRVQPLHKSIFTMDCYEFNTNTQMAQKDLLINDFSIFGLLSF